MSLVHHLGCPKGNLDTPKASKSGYYAPRFLLRSICLVSSCLGHPSCMLFTWTTDSASLLAPWLLQRAPKSPS